jgi:hypothetical protein
MYAANATCRLRSCRRNMRRREVHTRTNQAQRMSQRRAHRNPNLRAKRRLRKSKQRKSPKAHRQRTKKTTSLHQANRNPKRTAARRRIRLLMRRREQLRAVLPRKMPNQSLKRRNRPKGPVRAAGSPKRGRQMPTMRSQRRRRRRRNNCTDESMALYETWARVVCCWIGCSGRLLVAGYMYL